MTVHWVYRRTESQLWTVGYYDPEGAWYTDSDHGTPGEAADRVHYLNGGAMATTGEMRKQFRTLWERAEEVGKVRAAKGRRELSTAITCRNDAILGIELAFSALRSENKRLKATITKMDKEASNG